LDALNSCPDGRKLLDEYAKREPKFIGTRERQLIVKVGVDLLMKKTVSPRKHYPESWEKMCLAKEIVFIFSCLVNKRAETAYVAFYTSHGKGFIDQRLEVIRSYLPPEEKKRKVNNSDKKRECKAREYLYDTDKNLDKCVDDAEVSEKVRKCCQNCFIACSLLHWNRSIG
jgi:hypothetical protein